MNTELQKKLIESRKLNKYRVRFSTDALDVDVFWMRAVYSESESLLTKRTKHTFYEIQYALKGSVSMTVGDKQGIICRESEFIVIPPNVYHSITDCAQNSAKFIMAFSVTGKDSRVRRAIAELDACVPRQDSANLRGLLSMIFDEAYRGSVLSDKVISSLTGSFILELLNILLPAAGDDPVDVKADENDARVTQVLAYIRRTGGVGVRVSELAEKYNFSERHLGRLFREKTGRSLRETIRMEKLRHIEELMASTSLSLYEIAELCGFADEYAMNRFFKRAEWMTASEYRRFIRK